MLSNAQLKALRWLVEQLEKHHIEHQFVGGLAAIAHGSTRPLADIDLYINYKNSQHFIDFIQQHIYWGPKHEKDDCWDSTYLKMNYAGQKIEIGDSQHAFIFDKQLKQ
jgi:predicted metal-dependent phosphoesterase TrpH